MVTRDSHRKSAFTACPFGGVCPQSRTTAASPSDHAIQKHLQVLMYHRVCGEQESVTSRYVVSKRTFRRQMKFLTLHGFCTPTIENILRGVPSHCPAKRQPIIITFDDGYLDTYEYAFPVLQEFGLSAMVFLITDFSRGVNSWDENGALSKAPLLRPDHIRKMSESGIQFGIHSFTHPSLPSLSDAELEQELSLGRAAWRDATHQTFLTLAYPYGDVNQRVKNAAKKAGYHCAFSAYSGPLRYSSDLFEIRRIFMTNRSSPFYLLYKTSGLDHLFRWGVWFLKHRFGGRIMRSERPMTSL